METQLKQQFAQFSMLGSQTHVVMKSCFGCYQVPVMFYNLMLQCANGTCYTLQLLVGQVYLGLFLCLFFCMPDVNAMYRCCWLSCCVVALILHKAIIHQQCQAGLTQLPSVLHNKESSTRTLGVAFKRLTRN